MKIKKVNIKRLASLSALGAGALGATAGTAYASGIVYSGILDEQVGFPQTLARSITFGVPGGADGLLKRYVSRTGSAERDVLHSVYLQSRKGAQGTRFQFLAQPDPLHRNFASAFPLNQAWGSGCVKAHCKAEAGGEIAFFTGYSSSVFTHLNSTDKYLLFRFSGGSLPQALYGWAQLQVTFAPYPDVTLVDWAYDTSGAQIPAGDTGTPEPSTFVTTGLAALALGAKGLRAWRQKTLASKGT